MGTYEYDSRTGGTAASLAYDNAGNVTSNGDTEYYYDVPVRLTSAESGLNSNVFGGGHGLADSMVSPSAVSSGPNCAAEPKRGHVVRAMRWVIRAYALQQPIPSPEPLTMSGTSS